MACTRMISFVVTAMSVMFIVSCVTAAEFKKFEAKFDQRIPEASTQMDISAPFTDPLTLGAVLEEYFKALGAQCSLDLQPEITAIPSNLRNNNNIPLTSAVYRIDTLNEKSLFEFIFNGADISQHQSSTDPGRFLTGINLAGGGFSVASGDFSYINHNQSCTGMLAAALSAGIKIGPAQVNAALNAESGSSAELTLIQGTFHSPLYTLLYLSDPDTAMWTRLKLWANYERIYQIPKMNRPTYIAGFKGVLVGVGTRARFSYGYSAAASTDIDVAVAHANANGQLSFQKQAKTESRASTILIYHKSANVESNNASADTGTLDIDMKPIPLPKDIAEFFQNHPQNVVDLGGDTWLEASTYGHTLQLMGVPAEMCRKELWESVKPESEDQMTLILEEVDPIKNSNSMSGVNGCRFEVRFKPSLKFFNSSTPYSLTYELVYKKKLPNLGTEEGNMSYELTIKVSRTVNRERDLTIKQVGVAQGLRKERADRTVGVGWPVRLQFDDLRSRVNRSQSPKLKIVYGSSSCPNIQLYEPDFTKFAESGNEFTLTLDGSVDSTAEAFQVNDVAGRECTMILAVDLPLSGTKYAPQREVSITVKLPIVVPLPSP